MGKRKYRLPLRANFLRERHVWVRVRGRCCNIFVRAHWLQLTCFMGLTYISKFLIPEKSFRWKQLQMSTKMILQKKAANTMLWRPLKFRISRPICAKLWSKIIKLWLWSIFPNFYKLFPWLVYGQPSTFLITIIVFSLLAPNIYNSPVSNLSRPLNRSTEYSFIQG